MRELYVRGLAGHFCRNKNIDIIEYRFCWRSLKKNVACVVAACLTFQTIMDKKHNMSLYTPLSVAFVH